MKEVSDHEICEFLPSRKDVKDKLLDSNRVVIHYFDIIEQHLEEIVERIMDRKWPIFLWFTALIDKMRAGSKYFDADNLMRIMEK
jgi:hypothetical protein